MPTKLAPMRTSEMRKVRLLIAVFAATGICLLLALFLLTTAVLKAPEQSVFAAAWRYVLGEPGATQDVNNAADILEETGAYRELEGIADRIFADCPAAAANHLPVRHGPGLRLPVEFIPERFHLLGRSYDTRPDVILRGCESSQGMQLRLHWGNGRHAIVVSDTPPDELPMSFYSRQVSPRTYVIAHES
ncbi:MAG: hypothetical protein AAFQ77_01525 [Myxococcota bacterium]